MPGWLVPDAPLAIPVPGPARRATVGHPRREVAASMNSPTIAPVPGRRLLDSIVETNRFFESAPIVKGRPACPP
ncbi:hypothetical protein GCM10022255_054490 [Dactylosporangium darangshiense]|uniref:Uncharacterized protein n=1 Tax=Dactylosporangium darangshiense TaxID=579108 RepID=A0ABP8DEK5_9ACTN